MSIIGQQASIPPVGETVFQAAEYEAAQKVVSKLIAGEVPAKEISIVGTGVRTVERVTGRLGFGSAARSGAVNGALFGMFFGAILLLTTPEAPIQIFAAILFIGVAVGMLMSLITFTLVRRRRDFASVTNIVADSYEVKVLPTSFAKARRVLGTERPAPAREPVDLSEPPKYGERIVPDAAAGASPDAEPEQVDYASFPPPPAPEKKSAPRKKKPTA